MPTPNCQKLLSEKLRDLRDAMSRHRSLCFLLSPCYLQDTMPCQWSSSDLPQVLRILKQRLLLSDLFYLTLLPAGFKAQPQFNLKVSRTSHWSSKHSPARLFVWITTIHKRITLVSLYLSVMAGRPTKNVPLTGFELFSQQVAMSTASCFILLATETYNLHWIKVLVFAF